MAKNSPNGNETSMLPDISTEFNRYAALNPEFQIPISPRAQAVLRSVFYDENGNLRPVKQVARNILVFRERMQAIIPQLEENTVWQELLRISDLMEEQHEQYKEMVPAAESSKHPRKAPRTVAVSDVDFEKCQRTFYKTVQEIFAAPTERLDFKRDDSLEKFVDLSNVVIDPKMINDTLLENLGLVEFKPAKRAKPEVRIAACSRAIPDIKEMLDGLEPFRLSQEQRISRLKYFRLMRIGGGVNEGYVLGTQQINGKKILFKTDLHGASRRIDHIDDEYGNEIKKLIKITDTIRGIDQRVASSWAQVRDSDEMGKMSQKLLKMVEELKFVNNQHKIRIRQLIEGCVSFQTTRTSPRHPEDKKIVYNPGAMRARWNTVKDYVGKRISEIANIRKYLASDQTRIQKYIAAQQAPFERFYDTVESMHDKFKIFKTARPLSKIQADKICDKLTEIQKECQPVDGNFSHLSVVFEPYLTFARKMAEHIGKTVEILKQEKIDRDAAAEEFMKIYVIAKIQYFHHELQKFYDQFLSAEKMPFFVEMIGEIEVLKNIVRRKRVNAQVRGKPIKTPEYSAIFGEIYHLLNRLELMAKAAKVAMVSGNTKEAAKLKLQMHDRVRDFKFDQLLRSVKNPDVEKFQQLSITSKHKDGV